MKQPTRIILTKSLKTYDDCNISIPHVCLIVFVHFCCCFITLCTYSSTHTLPHTSVCSSLNTNNDIQRADLQDWMFQQAVVGRSREPNATHDTTLQHHGSTCILAWSVKKKSKTDKQTGVNNSMSTVLIEPYMYDYKILWKGVFCTKVS